MDAISVKTRKPRRLNQKQQLFLKVYLKTANPIVAYKQAGYKDNGGKQPDKWLRHKASHALNSPSIKAALAKIDKAKADQAVERDACTIDYIRSEHMRLATLAEAKHDLGVATRNLELLGRTVGAYVDGGPVDPKAHRAFTEKQRKEAKLITAVLIEKRLEITADAGTPVADGLVKAAESGVKATAKQGRGERLHALLGDIDTGLADPETALTDPPSPPSPPRVQSYVSPPTPNPFSTLRGSGAKS